MRWVVVALLLANLALLAWMQGWLGGWIALPGQGEREPGRMARQVNPELIRLIAPQAASNSVDAMAPAAGSAASDAAAGAAPSDAGASAPDAAASPISRAGAEPACLEAGPFASSEVAAAERALRDAQLAGVVWRIVKHERGGAFLVYLGKYADRAAMLKKQDELRRTGVAAEEVRSSPNLEPGLQLGRFTDRGEADAAQGQLAARGAKNARVVVITPPVPVTLLRVDKADAAQAERLAALRLGPAGAAFSACAPGERG